MSKLITGMTISLDGLIEDRDGSQGRLYADPQDIRDSDLMQGWIAETGAVLTGRRTFDMAEDPDWYVGNYEFQVPIVVVTHEPPPVAPKQDDNITFTFVEGVESAAAQARAAAGDRAVTVVGGPNVIRQLLRADLVDELHADVMPVLLGGGTRLFEDGDPAIELEKMSVQEVGARTSLRFRVVRSPEPDPPR
jgi:dihydrofolate reductase